MVVRIKFILSMLVISFMNITLFASDYKLNDIKTHYIGYFSLDKNLFFQKYVEIYCINGVRYFIVYGSKYVGISPMHNKKGWLMMNKKIKQETLILYIIDINKDDIKLARELMCPKCGGNVYPVAGEIYPNGEIDPPHFDCVDCGYEGFEHDFQKFDK